MGPTECKYCGCNKFNADSVSMTRFRCGSSYWTHEETWQIANGCAAKCAVQLVEMRGQVQRAVAVLEGARRICVGLCDEDGEDVESEHDGVIYVESTEADRAAAILRGNSSKSPDSSPITTDDLASSDYFEQTWHPADSPPLAHRPVMLRFNTTGDLDCRGHYCEGSFFLEGREPARYRVCLPTHWRHLKTEDLR